MFEAIIFLVCVGGYILAKEFEKPAPIYYDCTYEEDEEEDHDYEH